MFIKFKKKIEGYSLIEIIIVINIFAIVFGSISVLSLDVLRASQIRRYRVEAQMAVQEQFNAIELNKNHLWASIMDATETGTKHVEFSSGVYHIVDGPGTEGEINISFEIYQAYRDINGFLTETAGTIDPNTRRISLIASWTDKYGFVGDYQTSYYVTNWNTPVWTETTQTDFSSGTLIDTLSTANGDGAVELDLSNMIRGDWCSPELTMSQHNMARQGVPTAIAAVPNYAFLTTGENASGPPLEYVNITSDNPPTVTSLGTYDAETIKVYDIYVEGDYIYIANTDKQEEVKIFDHSAQTFNKVGSFSYNSSRNPTAVTANENVGYITVENNLYVFDLTSKTGTRPQLSQFTLAGNAVDMEVKDGYAYVLIQGSSTKMQILDVSNPSSISQAGTASFTSADPTSLFVRDDRVYIGTKVSATVPEFFIVDISTKTGSRPVIGTVDSNGTEIRGLAIVDNRAMLVGIGGLEYQVYNIEDETNPISCGGLNNDYGILGISTVIDEYNNSWAYILTGNANAELMVVLGGKSLAGGGNGQGNYYVSSGQYESSVFDTLNPLARYYSLTWDETVYANTDIQIQLRSGDTVDLSGIDWVGPDGTSATYFTEPVTTQLPEILQNHRYIQYKLYFTSDLVNTPVLEAIRINYQNG